MVTKILRRAKLPSFANEGSSLDPVPSLAARGRSRKDGFPIVGAVCDRPYFVNSRKNARSQTAPTIDTANSTGFCHGLLGRDRPCKRCFWLRPEPRCVIADY